ncbi:Major facilitator superfamily domain, general substrate transporter [Niveomyces insectorum RCEF 264]|uniref:Major facilitator superfamily domain, general substrate transporter n=1 Tax=Niveomyces insectorum RCEF 264 TaxID=1081102 RepID=A0A168A5C2_9HYPO|nr:Major facilitator superfamily domain, general substrate transporter [Niveomyces insectorum RCEF 264]
MITRSVHYVYRESGLASVFSTGVDAWIIIVARSCRMFAYGASALVLALFFAELNVSDERIGLFMTLTLVGDVGLSLLLTLVADHVGRRRTLLFGSVLMILSGATFALCENYWLLLIAAVAGVISATGGDFGPFRAVEESMLSEITNPATRADVLVWYVTTSALGSSVGTEIAGRAVHYLHGGSGGKTTGGWSLLQAYHVCYWAYAAMGVVNFVLSLLLSTRIELHQGRGSDEGAIAMTPQSNRRMRVPRSTSRGADNNSNNDDHDDASSTLSSDTLSIGSFKTSGRARADHDGDDNDDDDSAHKDEDGRNDEIDGAENEGLLPSSSSTPTLPSSPSSPASSSSSPSSPTEKKSRFSQISRQTRSTMYGLWFLFMVDSLADGMANMSLTSYYIDTKFHVSKDSLGNILSASYFLAACSSVFAGPLSRSIGLVNTMVFTHVPSSAAVLLFPLPQSVVWTYALLLLRVGLNNLDQAPRSALIAAVVRPSERTAVMGITSMLRTLASTTGPSLTGLLAGGDRFWIAFVVAGALRLAYDFGLFAMFVKIRLYQYETVPGQEDGGNGTAAATAAAEADTTDMGHVPGHPDAFVLDEEESIE